MRVSSAALVVPAVVVDSASTSTDDMSVADGSEGLRRCTGRLAIADLERDDGAACSGSATTTVSVGGVVVVFCADLRMEGEYDLLERAEERQLEVIWER